MLMSWNLPSLSPDLRPIENIRADLIVRVFGRQTPPTNIKKLRQALFQSRNNSAYAIGSMRRRCVACIQVNEWTISEN